MTDKEYFNWLQKQQNNITEDVQKAIDEQIRLGEIAREKQDQYYKLQDKEIELLKIGGQKFFEKYPGEINIPENDMPIIDIIDGIIKQSLLTPQKNADVVSKMNEIPELKQHGKMVNEIAQSAYEYVQSFFELETKIRQDRENLFSQEYLDKMSQFADEGVLLYFLETPDMPLLDNELTTQKIIDIFYYKECATLQTLLYSIMQLRDASPSMKRKTDDIEICLQLIIYGYSYNKDNNQGYFRTATRNLFALLDNEHKKCADVFEGIINKKKRYRTGLQRANKIHKLIDDLNLKWENMVWDKINSFYKKINLSEKCIGVINRNSIVHGDYTFNEIDVSANDVMKLMLLWINMRLLADELCHIDEMLGIFLTYLPSIIKNEMNKCSSNLD